ncbi:nucleoside-diphosphate sugar epimerase/dehydratase [Neomegalonema sp.]|uniref:polysaccharide biosynthesis protein n=1 Tax=Neomegalonema sp. TaxID=2039713 RepID=UPI002613FFEE|nr:nucleoside-diphosphate sugar epimerase/dehydratase [Neomegalonema sp.]MDD2870021.1 nucleoside-diphosphate sugar epimerase/dehydratase [Neomegalonema sp.]
MFMKTGVPIIIYGAGASGVQMLLVTNASREYRAVAFVDDDAALQGTAVHGLQVHAPEEMRDLIAAHEARTVLLAMPSISGERRAEIATRLRAAGADVHHAPTIHQIVGGNLASSPTISLDEILGRPPSEEGSHLAAEAIRDRVVLVTGAGGSIGSELCAKLLCFRPRTLIAYEMNEYALYKVEQNLQALNAVAGDSPTTIVPVLGSVLNQARLEQLIRAHGVSHVYHAAAYKHVPLVESNVLEGVRNNVLGTLAVVEACVALGVGNLVLVSTDKAVRPTNVMGATKRISEIILQDAQRRNPGTVFSMVRFGNVLGSSGSVIPRFYDQIKQGGPVTVTHAEITRYFMTISEAAFLVVQASVMARGGDVFLLDMGEPVKIVALAQRMIRMMGHLPVLPGEEGEGVRITFSGLRPGEKLYEELLIDSVAEETSHPKIARAVEDAPSALTVSRLLAELKVALERNDAQRVIEILSECVQDYVSSGLAGDPEAVARPRPLLRSQAS